MTTAPSMTYNSLLQDVESYAERHDAEFVSQIPRLVMMAENSIASKVRGLGMQRVASSSMGAGDSVLEKPTRWRESISMSIETGVGVKTIYMRTYEFCRRVSPAKGFQSQPRYYADYDAEHFLIVPSPDTAYPFELLYYERPQPLADSNQTNWTTRYAPQLLLYATLLEAQSFLKNDQKLQVFQARYAEAVADIEAEAKRRTFDRAAGVREA